MIGGVGNDILTGGEGIDIFTWQEGDLDGSTDTITDFELKGDAQGNYQGETVDLSDLFNDLNDSEVNTLLDSIEQSISGDDNHSTLVVEKAGQQVTIEFEGISATDLTNNLTNMLVLKDDG